MQNKLQQFFYGKIANNDTQKKKEKEKLKTEI